ncbi:E3 ubiquitin-protein ligase TRIM39 [Nerophis lumbriciformis]|uniref:E3 ubiquitin-protein ligase TRIM39 n=1 Tax=Nerophis lumbriciformis TaxID=546530 RepID=UPI002AE0A352|nr:E3 ubiquitin/ISG15 ligase TRIM25-like [Nerophis lumbriciformis]XP_061840687.1 E3 ubiquitin/ISG15 ligase TRIM25-like [Nerophis lumbriciformis]
MSTSHTNTTEAMALVLSCPICLQLYSEPASLPCGHIYCRACIVALGEGLDHHSCPECRVDYQGNQALVTSFKMCSVVQSYKAFAAKGAADSGPICTDSNVETSESKPQTRLTKLKLASHVTELAAQLEIAEDALKEEEAELMAANEQQREQASKHLQQVSEVLHQYQVQVWQVIEDELSPGEASVKQRVHQAGQLTQQLRHVLLRAESLSEEDQAEFPEDLQPQFQDLIERLTGDHQDRVESKLSPARVIPKLEQLKAELKERLGVIHHSLRNTFNPSEVTFDLGTAHPNLVLSEDLKTVTFSATKLPYPPSPQRFTSFLQVLSSQSFYQGDHCWEVELDGAPWIVGVCDGRTLERSGLASALESSRGSWCLMWFENLLTAFQRGRDVPLMRTTVSCRLEIRLNCSSRTLSFYNIGSGAGKTLVHTCEVNLTEPAHLAYRMMSGHSKARITIIS